MDELIQKFPYLSKMIKEDYMHGIAHFTESRVLDSIEYDIFDLDIYTERLAISKGYHDDQAYYDKHSIR